MFESYEILDFLEFQNDGKRHFHINRLDEMPELPAKIKSPHKHLFYEVFLITQGKARVPHSSRQPFLCVARATPSMG
jgi:hypothetical protein